MGHRTNTTRFNLAGDIYGGKRHTYRRASYPKQQVPSLYDLRAVDIQQ